jgi:mitogen-activated protein kinase kinase kinase
LKTEHLKKKIKSIMHEIKMLRELHHPNIVKYYYTDISEDGKGVDIALEFVPGGSIR